MGDVTALDALLDRWDALSKGETETTKAIRHAIDIDVASSPGWFWTPTEWAEWSNELAGLFGEDEGYGNPEGAQESVILDTFREWAKQRQAVLAIHHPDPTGEWCDYCWTGPDTHGNGAPDPEWPCPTAQALGVLG